MVQPDLKPPKPLIKLDVFDALLGVSNSRLLINKHHALLLAITVAQRLTLHPSLLQVIFLGSSKLNDTGFNNSIDTFNDLVHLNAPFFCVALNLALIVPCHLKVH